MTLLASDDLARFTSARAESTFTPAVVGFLTVLVPCGVTLSVEFLIIANGSSVTLQKVAPGVAAAVPQALGGGKAATEGLSGQTTKTDQPIPLARVGADGIQVVDIGVSYGDAEGGGAPFAPTIIQAKAGLATRVAFHAAGDLGCASVVVLQKRGIEKGLKPGETSVDLGVLSAGDIGFSCGTGMYGGVIKVIDG